MRRRRPVAAGLLALSLLAACDRGETQVSGGGPGTTASEGTTGTMVTAATGTFGSLPPEPLPSPITTNVIQGERVYGVYLAVAPFDAPELDTAVEQLAALGVEAFPGEISCDQGAAEQLGVANDLAAVAIYFERRPDALAWIEALDPPPIGIAVVELFCAD